MRGWVPPCGGLDDDTTEESTRFVLAIVVATEHEPDEVQCQQTADQPGKLGDVAADKQAREDEREQHRRPKASESERWQAQLSQGLDID
jgi:hypothetical protein